MVGKYYAVLSGLHATLPLAELRAILEAHQAAHKILCIHDQLVVFKSDKQPRFVVERAGFVREVGMLLAITEADEKEVVNAADSVDWRGIVGSSKFKVKVERLRGYAKHVDELRLARLLGSLIMRACPNARVDVVEPEKVVRVVLTEGIAVLGLRLAELDTGQLMERRPQRKPFFKPGALDPRLSRVFVNLSRPSPGEVFLDPFCGTGGFAVEAELMGLEVLCGELAGELAAGSFINLKRYCAGGYFDAIQADAAKMPLREECIDAIGTDPPYGRSSSTRGRRLEELLKLFLHEAARILKKGRYVAFAVPHWVKPLDYIREAGLQLVETHYMRVHGSLTRILVVAKKP